MPSTKEKMREYNKQYRIDNKDKIREQRKEYRAKNKDKIYQKITCECGAIVSKKHLQRHKSSNKHQKKQCDNQYRANNDKLKEQRKEKNKERKREYYINNRDKILEQQKEYKAKNKDKIYQKITCECGAIVSKKHLQRHKKSNKHKSII